MKAPPSGLGGNQHESATVAEAVQNMGATESQKAFEGIWMHLRQVVFFLEIAARLVTLINQSINQSNDSG